MRSAVQLQLGNIQMISLLGSPLKCATQQTQIDTQHSLCSLAARAAAVAADAAAAAVSLAPSFSHPHFPFTHNYFVAGCFFFFSSFICAAVVPPPLHTVLRCYLRHSRFSFARFVYYVCAVPLCILLFIRLWLCCFAFIHRATKACLRALVRAVRSFVRSLALLSSSHTVYVHTKPACVWVSRCVCYAVVHSTLQRCMFETTNGGCVCNKGTSSNGQPLTLPSPSLITIHSMKLHTNYSIFDACRKFQQFIKDRM